MEGTRVSERRHGAETSATHDETSQEWKCASQLQSEGGLNAGEIQGNLTYQRVKVFLKVPLSLKF